MMTDITPKGEENSQWRRVHVASGYFLGPNKFLANSRPPLDHLVASNLFASWFAPPTIIGFDSPPKFNVFIAGQKAPVESSAHYLLSGHFLDKHFPGVFDPEKIWLPPLYGLRTTFEAPNPIAIAGTMEPPSNKIYVFHENAILEGAPATTNYYPDFKDQLSEYIKQMYLPRKFLNSAKGGALLFSLKPYHLSPNTPIPQGTAIYRPDGKVEAFHLMTLQLMDSPGAVQTVHLGICARVLKNIIEN